MSRVVDVVKSSDVPVHVFSGAAFVSVFLLLSSLLAFSLYVGRSRPVAGKSRTSEFRKEFENRFSKCVFLSNAGVPEIIARLTVFMEMNGEFLGFAPWSFSAERVSVLREMEELLAEEYELLGVMAAHPENEGFGPRVRQMLSEYAEELVFRKMRNSEPRPL